MMRPLWVEFPNDVQTFHVENEYMVGDALLVHPVTEPQVSNVEVFLPGADQVVFFVLVLFEYFFRVSILM